MQIETKFLGTQEIIEENILFFKHGLPGFENFHKYIMLNYKDDSPFFIMQSVEEASLAFILIGLEQVVPGYSIEITDDIVAELGIKQPEDVLMCAIVSIPGDMAKATVNLAAPLCINVKKKCGKQIILNNPQYTMRHPLFSAEPKQVIAFK